MNSFCFGPDEQNTCFIRTPMLMITPYIAEKLILHEKNMAYP
jgi:hypothetical protein